MLDGQVFAQLERFEVDEHGWPGTFKHQVRMPACTYIGFKQDMLKILPVLQSSFHVPLLDTWELINAWHTHGYDWIGICALQGIHAKVFKLAICGRYKGLLDMLESRDEVERLELALSVVKEREVLNGFTISSGNMRKVPCPNMKVLWLSFWFVEDERREEASQWCMEMMDKRRLAGYPIVECCIWWSRVDQLQKKAASLVLVLQNEVVRVE